MSRRKIIENGFRRGPGSRGLELITDAARKMIYPPGLIHLWTAQYPVRSRVGKPLTYSFAGPVSDGRGSLTTGPPIHREGLWCGPAYTNLLPSGAEEQTTWLGANISVDGDKLTGTTGEDTKYLTVGYGSTVSGEQYTIRIHLQYAGFQWIRLGFGAEGFANLERNAWFDVQNGVLGTVQNNVYATIEQAAEGGYICTVRATASASVDLTAQLCMILLVDTDGGWMATGDGVKGVIAKDPQVVNAGADTYPYILPGTTSASAAGTAGGNGAAFKTSAKVGACLNELFINPFFVNVNESNTISYNSETGAYRLVSDGSVFTALVVPNVLDGAGLETYRLVYEEVERISGNVKLTSSGPDIELRNGSETIVFTSDLTNIVIGRTGGGCDVTFRASIQKLVPPSMTLSALLTMGVSSDQVQADQLNANILSWDKSPAPFTYQYNPGGARIASVSDGSSLAETSATWNALDSILVLFQVSSNGTQFRSGYKNIAAEQASITWSEWTAYDGSFSPLDYIRLGFLSGVPVWIQKLQIWKEQVTEEQLGEVSTYAIQ